MADGAVASIDCGTNSTRLLIASGSGDTIDRQMRITRLGAGVDRTGRLDSEAIRRTLEVLGEYRLAMDRAGVVRSLASATSAARDASNAADFLGPATETLGTAPKVLDGEVEGQLSYRGATAELEPTAGPYVVVDIGGGSTELVTSSSGAGIAVSSLDVGCVRVTERFLFTDPPSPEELSQAAALARGLVAHAARDHPEFSAARRLVGLAGTVSALAVLALGLSDYDRDLVHHTVLTQSRVEELIGELAAVPLAERRQRPGMERDRADVLIGGAVILDVVMDELGQTEALVSEADILDGIVAELLEPSGLLA